MITKTIALILITLWIIEIISGPFYIDKEKANKTWTAGDYISKLLIGAGTIYICGKLLGWW